MPEVLEKDEPTSKELAGPVNELLWQLKQQIDTRFDKRDNDLAEKLGKQIEEGVKQYLEAFARENPSFSVPGMNEQKEKFSIARAIVAMTNKNWSYAPFEHECFKSMSKMYGEVYHKATMSSDSGTAAEGQYLVPEEHMNEIIDLLYANSVAFKLGARAMPNQFGEITIPVLVTGASAAWYAQNAAISASDPTVGEHTMRPRQLGSSVRLSNVLLANSRPIADEIIMGNMEQQFRTAIDAGVLTGPGTGASPTGITISTQTPAAGAVDLATGGVWTYNLANEFITDVANANALEGSLGWAMSPTQLANVQTMLDVTNQPLERRVVTDGRLDHILGYPVQTTTLLPNTGEGVIFGDWSQVRVPFWKTLELRASDVAEDVFLKNQTLIRGILYADISIDHLQAFSIGTLV